KPTPPAATAPKPNFVVRDSDEEEAKKPARHVDTNIRQAGQQTATPPAAPEVKPQTPAPVPTVPDIPATKPTPATPEPQAPTAPPPSPPPPGPLPDQPAAGASNGESFVEDLYTCKPTDSYRSVSVQLYGTAKYERALQKYNQDFPPIGGATALPQAGQKLRV